MSFIFVKENLLKIYSF